MRLLPSTRSFASSRIDDVVVVGGGNAGLCAAIMARQSGAMVLLLEQAPRDLRGGNSRHARNLRVAHRMPSGYMHGLYLPNEYWEDLIRVTAGQTNASLARSMIDQSAHVMPWMAQCGARFQSLRSGARRPSRKTVFLLGGGKALLNAYYLTAERLGIDILYETEVVSFHFDGGIARSVTALTGGAAATIHAKAFVVTSGGIQSDIDWLKRYWGDAADGFLIRGTAYAKGQILKDLLDQGAAPVGNPAQWHIVAVDARAPKFDGGIVSRIDCLPLGIVVDRNGRRFHDEGANIGPERYAIWGNLVAQCPSQIAYAIFDSKIDGLSRPSLYPPIRAPTIAELAAKLALNPSSVMATVDAFNAAVQDTLHGKSVSPGHTEYIAPLKSRWALPIDTPPFDCFPLRPGVTFNYFGVKVDENAHVLMTNGRESPNTFAAGSIMAANVLGRGYLAGIGIAIGTVFGRIAGREAAYYANSGSHRDRAPRH